MCLTAKNFGLQEENTRDRSTERGMIECVMKKEDKVLINVKKKVETTYFDNCAFFAALASFLLQ